MRRKKKARVGQKRKADRRLPKVWDRRRSNLARYKLT
jgi:hypothetical protein